MRMTWCWGLLLAAVSLTASVTVISQDDNRVLLQYDWNDLQLVQEGDFLAIRADGLTHDTTVGMTDIPWRLETIGIPDDGSISVRVVDSQTRYLPLDRPVVPVPEIIPGTPTADYRYTSQPRIPEARRILEILPSHRYRTLNVATLRVNPFGVEGSKLVVHDHIRVEITISGDKRGTGDGLGDDPISRGAVINYDTARNWRQRSGDRTVRYADFAAFTHWASCEVPRDGIFRIGYEELDNVLPVADIDPAQLRVFSTGGATSPYSSNNPGLPFDEVPLLMVDGSDSSFDPGDYFLFFGRDRDGEDMNAAIDSVQFYNPYSQSTVYWITYGDDGFPAARISASDPSYNLTRTTHPEPIHYEQETVKRVSEGFDWFSASFSYIDHYTSEYPYHVTVTDIAPGNPTFYATVQEAETADSHYHELRIKVNGDEIAYSGWSGTLLRNLSGVCTSLVEGDNTVTFRYIRQSPSTLLMDHFDVVYPQTLRKHDGQKTVNRWPSDESNPVRYMFESGYESGLMAFQVTDFDEVAQRTVTAQEGSGFSFTSTGGVCYVLAPDEAYSVTSLKAREPENLAESSPQYNAVIVAPAEFLDRAETLRGLYQSNLDLNARVVDQQAIFDQFAGGNPDPNAIRLYMKYLIEAGAPLHYLTLMGSGVFDWRNFSGSSGTKDRVIAFQKNTGTVIYPDYVTTDDYFSYLYQAGYPEIATGRYPAQTTEQLDIMLDHVRDYLETYRPGWWKSTMVFLADDNRKSLAYDGTNHTWNIQENAQEVSRSCYVDKIFALTYDMDEFHNKPQVRDLMIDKVNQGCLVWYYSGHGAPDIIGDERYFMTSDIPALDNLDHLPLFIASSCSVGEYDLYRVDCLAEQMVYQEDGGAIVSLAATRTSYPSPNTDLMGSFLQRMINDRQPVGIALAAAKVINASNNSSRYNLLGDPALPILPPERTDELELDGGEITFPTLKTVHFQGDFEMGDLDGEAEIRVYDPEQYTTTISNLTYTFSNSGNLVFRGRESVTDDTFDGGFVIPYDANQGATGRVIVYYHDSEGKEKVCFLQSLTFQGHDFIAENPDSPSIRLWLDSKGFQDGDPVGASPTLIAEIADSNGVNILGTPGHRILTRIDDSTELVDITSSFEYSLDSFTSGELQHDFEGLEQGAHTVQVIALDNLNTPAISTANFRVTAESGESARISIEDPLPHPSPWNGKGRFHFTFFITENADVSVSIYTITGKKIRTIKAPALSKGFQQVEWDGRDADGDTPANNTYIYRIKASMIGGDSHDEASGKLVIYR